MRTPSEHSRDERLAKLSLELIPKMGAQWNQHNLVTLRRQTLSRLLYFDLLYRNILGKPGTICEFGVQWGAGLITLINLRGIHEPFNHQREILGFDTFSGFPATHSKDGSDPKVGDYAVATDHEKTLAELMKIHEQNAPLSHISKSRLIVGDASETVLAWLDNNPQAVIALAIFDMDLYQPTRDVLEAIKPRLFKGSIIAFDEFNNKVWPGETEAIREILGLNRHSFHQFAHQPTCSWIEYS